MAGERNVANFTLIPQDSLDGTVPVFANMKLCIVALMMTLVGLAGQDTEPNKSSFVRADLPAGVSLDVPRGWTLTGADEKRLIDTYAESVEDLTKIPHGKSGTLLAATAPTSTGYMSITVVFERKQTATQQQLQQIPPAQLAELDKQNRKDIEAGSYLNGLKIVSWEGTTVEKIGGYWALVKRYTYTLPGMAPRKMENCGFFLEDKLVSLLFQSGEHTLVPAKPIFERVKSTVTFK
jgi:hypothetical protein